MSHIIYIYIYPIYAIIAIIKDINTSKHNDILSSFLQESMISIIV